MTWHLQLHSHRSQRPLLRVFASLASGLESISLFGYLLFFSLLLYRYHSFNNPILYLLLYCFYFLFFNHLANLGTFIIFQNPHVSLVSGTSLSGIAAEENRQGRLEYRFIQIQFSLDSITFRAYGTEHRGTDILLQAIDPSIIRSLQSCFVPFSFNNKQFEIYTPTAFCDQTFTSSRNRVKILRNRPFETWVWSVTVFSSKRCRPLLRYPARTLRTLYLTCRYPLLRPSVSSLRCKSLSGPHWISPPVQLSEGSVESGPVGSR